MEATWEVIGVPAREEEVGRGKRDRALFAAVVWILLREDTLKVSWSIADVNSQRCCTYDRYTCIGSFLSCFAFGTVVLFWARVTDLGSRGSV